jgi:hypothetical protein
MAGGDEKAAAAGYYGGPGGLFKAKQGIAVRDPKNPNAPDTLQYGEQVAKEANQNREFDDFDKALFSEPEKKSFIEVRGANQNDINPHVFGKADESKTGQLKSAAAGFGQSWANTGASIGQLAGKGVGFFDKETGKAIEEKSLQIAKEAEKYTKEYTDINPKSAMAGEIAGMIVNPVNKVIPFAGVGKGILSATVRGATQGAMLNALTTPVTDENKSFITQKAKQAVTGGIAGGVGGAVIKGASKLVEPVSNALSKSGNEAVKTLREAGVPIDIAQATGSKAWQREKAALADNPFTAGKEAEFAATQKAAYNKAIAKTMGEEADSITPEVIQRAKDRLGQNYDDIAMRNNIHFDKELNSSIKNIESEAQQVLNPEQFSTIKRQVDNILAKADENGGALHGDQYLSLKRVLDKVSKKSDTDVANYAKELKETLLEGLSRSAEKSGNGADVKLLKETNKQYGNMKKIEDVALKDPEGNVSPALLHNSLATKGKRNAIYQEDPQLANLARAGKQILSNTTPNSGTMARMLAQRPLFAAGHASYHKLAQLAKDSPTIANRLEKGYGLEGINKAFAKMPKYMQKPGGVSSTLLSSMVSARNKEK